MRRLYSIMTITLLTLTVVYGLITNETQAVTVEESFEYSGIKKLQVDGMFFRVRAEGYSGNIVQGTIMIPKKLAEGDYVEVSHAKRENVLSIRVIKKKVVIPPFSDEAVIEIRVPVNTGLDIKTASGVIEIEKIDTDEIRLSSSSGKIHAKDLSAEGIGIKSSSGSIDISTCKGPLHIKSSSGRISAKEASGNISAFSSSGRQTYERIEGDIVAQSSSGNITIYHLTGTLDLKATSGDLEGHDVLLEGNSTFTTSSGRMNFEFDNNIDDFSFDLNSSSGILHVGQSRAKGRLVIGKGKIKITGKSSSGNQAYK